VGENFQSNLPTLLPVMNTQSLVLPIIGGFEPYGAFGKSLAATRTYALEPSRMRSIQDAEFGVSLEPDGSNIANVLADVERRDPKLLARVSQLLSPVVPGGITVRPQVAGQKVFILFAQQVSSTQELLLDALNMSDGTMTALGLIVAALQDPPPSVLTIEEPEATLHPGAMDAVVDLLDMATERSQVVITTHSPELLDTKWIKPENLRVVEWEKGTTHISNLGEAPIHALQQHLMGAGELLRANALDAAPPRLEDTSDLFDENLA
jgi:predicted ATPase